MKSREERLKEQNKLLQLREEVEKELKKIPGVFGIGVGLREKDGKITDEICFRVYVNKKKVPANIKPEEMIPKEIKGIKTDVIIKQDVTLIADEDKYRPLIGGISVTNNKTSRGGTLGCLAELNSDKSIVLLSNHHVLYLEGAGVGDKVGQPSISSCCCCTCDEIGTILNGIDNADIDAAIARVTTNEGGTNEIKEIGWIAGSTAAVLGDRVRKRGKTTLLTIGTVTDVAKPAGGKVNQIEITPQAAHPRFAYYGDSGSVVVNDNNEVVGLLYAIDAATETKGFACHIDKVEAQMGIKIIRTGTAGSIPAFLMESTPIEKSEEEKLLKQLEEELKQYEVGRKVLDTIDEFRHEVITLINTNKEVKVAWNKYHGPTFAAVFLRNLKEKNHNIPKEINGIRLENLLVKMNIALEQHGSKKLVGALEANATQILDIAYSCNTLNDIKNYLQKEEKASMVNN